MGEQAADAGPLVPVPEGEQAIITTANDDLLCEEVHCQNWELVLQYGWFLVCVGYLPNTRSTITRCRGNERLR